MVPFGPYQVEAPFPHILANSALGSVLASSEAVLGDLHNLHKRVVGNVININTKWMYTSNHFF